VQCNLAALSTPPAGRLSRGAAQWHPKPTPLSGAQHTMARVTPLPDDVFHARTSNGDATAARAGGNGDSDMVLQDAEEVDEDEDLEQPHFQLASRPQVTFVTPPTVSAEVEQAYMYRPRATSNPQEESSLSAKSSKLFNNDAKQLGQLNSADSRRKRLTVVQRVRSKLSMMTMLKAEMGVIHNAYGEEAAPGVLRPGFAEPEPGLLARMLEGDCCCGKCKPIGTT
jgi:hypothetical protein